MSTFELITLILLFFATSIVGVVTGSNSLVTVPVMFQFGIDPRVAVATNMFGLTFMSIGATIPFLRSGTIERKTVTPLILITVVASAIGAALVSLIAPGGLKLIVSIAMIVVTVFTLLNRNAGVKKFEASSSRTALVYVLTFALGVYGGLYSGGYVTMLTAVFVGLFGMKFSESVAATKVINVFSSAIATAVFMWQGLVDYRLGLILGASMFAGAYIGAHTVTKMSDVWLKRIFVIVVLALALKTILDFGF
ncbi:MAG: sulfite exporter TauE/SafE family protein [Acidobacteria bacterium]|nr:sulfite exporter TauE/SafE family protein [Acidobacteriota bacterium]MBK8813940.1 sulfite exporter TauE/SafE family protein [Acidobacteriota bacterium]